MTASWDRQLAGLRADGGRLLVREESTLLRVLFRVLLMRFRCPRFPADYATTLINRVYLPRPARAWVERVRRGVLAEPGA